MKEGTLDLDRFPVTQRQLEFLSVIRNWVAENGFPPTRAEMAKAMGFNSPNGAQTHLEALRRKGLIRVDAGAARGIQLTDEAMELVPGPPTENKSLFATDVPVVGSVAAGSPILSEQNISTSYALPNGMFRQQPDYFLTVRGNSMVNAGILDGDLVAIRAMREARSGQIVVARLDGEVTLKRLHKTPTGYTLLAENPDFKPIKVKSDDFAVEGIAVGLVRIKDGF